MTATALPAVLASSLCLQSCTPATVEFPPDVDEGIDISISHSICSTCCKAALSFGPSCISLVRIQLLVLTGSKHYYQLCKN